MVNTMDLGRGFLKLQEDNNSRRSSSLSRHKPLELNENGLHYVTRINCGCGQCVPFRVKVEKDDGGLRIGKLTLATNCHLVIVIFGLFFLIAGSVLTALAYKEPAHDPDHPLHERASSEHLDSPSRQEGKVAGPIFIVVGSALILMGFTLTALACKLNREAKRQLQLSRFTWETPPLQTPDIFNNSSSTPGYHHQAGESGHFPAFANNLDTYSACSANSGRRDSSFTFSRQQQNPPPPLATIAQAVPVGMFLFGGGSPKSPTIQVTDPSGFQEIELSSPTAESAPASATAFYRGNGTPAGIPPDAYYKKHRSQSDGASIEDIPRTGSYEQQNKSNANMNLSPNDPRSQSKVNLALRPSLPIIPMFAAASSPHYFSRVVTPLDARSLYVSSRSDEPFGSIASLSTSGDIACFPVTQTSTISSAAKVNSGTAKIEECDESQSASPSLFTKLSSNQSSLGANIANNNDTGISQKNDVNVNLNNSSKGGSRSQPGTDVINAGMGIPRNTFGISDLPPINVNEFGRTGKAPPGFQPKSILRQTKSEDWQEGNAGDDDGGEILEKN